MADGVEYCGIQWIKCWIDLGMASHYGTSQHDSVVNLWVTYAVQIENYYVPKKSHAVLRRLSTIRITTSNYQYTNITNVC